MLTFSHEVYWKIICEPCITRTIQEMTYETLPFFCIESIGRFFLPSRAYVDLLKIRVNFKSCKKVVL